MKLGGFSICLEYFYFLLMAFDSASLKKKKTEKLKGDKENLQKKKTP